MAVRITPTSSPALIRQMLKTGWLLPDDDRCSPGSAMPTRALLDAHILRGEVWAYDDGTAYGMKMDGKVTWFVCAVADVPVKGKDVLDSLVPAGTAFRGVVSNDALRTAIVTARPDITVDGSELVGTAS